MLVEELAKVDPSGTVTTFADVGLLSCPNGIALADDDHFYVANFYNNKLVRVDPEGSVRPFASLDGSNLGHVTWGNDRLYVAVRGEHSLAEVDLSGAVTPLVGTGQIGADDGDLDTATLSYPNDIALSPDGRTLYFNDVHPDHATSNIIGPVLIRALVLP